MLAPATGFYGTKGLGKNEVRLAYVLNLDSINAAMDCLEKALQQYPERTEKSYAPGSMVGWHTLRITHILPYSII